MKMKCLCGCPCRKDQGNARCSKANSKLDVSDVTLSFSSRNSNMLKRVNPPAVYYVKGSRVPVETLVGNSARDSRNLYPARREFSSSELCNPGLVFLLNWQSIPPVSRLAILQRAVRHRNVALLPAVREVLSQEGGDRRDSFLTAQTTAHASCMAEGDQRPGQSRESTQQRTHTPELSPLNLTTETGGVSCTADRSNGNESPPRLRPSSPARRPRRQC